MECPVCGTRLRKTDQGEDLFLCRGTPATAKHLFHLEYPDPMDPSRGAEQQLVLRLRLRADGHEEGEVWPVPPGTTFSEDE